MKRVSEKRRRALVRLARRRARHRKSRLLRRRRLSQGPLRDRSSTHDQVVLPVPISIDIDTPDNTEALLRFIRDLHLHVFQRSDEHTSELQSLMRNSLAVLYLE